MDGTKRFDTTLAGDPELEHELRAYASARLTPDRFATNRMRVAVIEHARARQQLAATPAAHGRFASLRLSFRGLAAVALVAAIAITAGTTAGVAASPGGPLYGLRLQIETALLPSSGEARTDAQVGLLNERTEEITDALAAGNGAGADAAANAYSDQVDQAVTNAGSGTNVAQQRSDLLDLRATLVRQLAHFQSLVKPNDKAGANLQNLISRTQAAIAAVDRQLAALPPAP